MPFKDFLSHSWTFTLAQSSISFKLHITRRLIVFSPISSICLFSFLIAHESVRFFPLHPVQSLSRVQLFLTPCSTPGLPVHHQHLELAQTHVRRVGDAIQPSHSLSSPSPPTFNLSQHQDLFQWISSSHHVAKVLELQLQHPSNEYSGLISYRID